MKMKSLVKILSGKMIAPLALASVVLLAAGRPAVAASAAELLEQGIYAEETKGELNAACRIYEQIMDDPGADRSLAAQAQLRLGLCELKLGNKPRAISALERLTREFPEKDKLLAMIDRQMPRLLDEIVHQIEQNYIQEMEHSELMETAIHAIIGKLDAQTGLLRSNDMSFLAANEVTQINEGLEQKIGGIGAALKLEEATREVMVTTPLPDSPALKAGLLAGDRIIEVNGAGLPQGKELETAVKLLRGRVGTRVTVGIKRTGSGELQNVELVRDTILLASVLGDHYTPDQKWEFMLDDQKKLGYIRLTQLGKRSPSEMQTALEGLKARGMRALILDLRNNPGGTLAEAVEVADLFVESGRILTVKGRKGEQVYEARAEGTFSGFPMVVLVNRFTASAAEIVAAALQDHHRALVTGERTFGQGVVRNLVPLKDGSALKLPVAAYYRPDGRNMNRYPNFKDSDEWGVSPEKEYEVKLMEDEQKQYEKNRRERDLLNNPGPIAPFQDRQLQKAIDLALDQK